MFAGVYHLRWVGAERRWNMTRPDGQTQTVDASTDGLPPAALINAFPGVAFAPVVTAIAEQALSPPPSTSGEED